MSECKTHNFFTIFIFLMGFRVIKEQYLKHKQIKLKLTINTNTTIPPQEQFMFLGWYGLLYLTF